MANKTNLKFEIGDVVKLNAGGPEMSVYEVLTGYDEYKCQWFAGKKLEEGFFEGRTLILVRKQGVEVES